MSACALIGLLLLGGTGCKSGVIDAEPRTIAELYSAAVAETAASRQLAATTVSRRASTSASPAVRFGSTNTLITRLPSTAAAAVPNHEADAPVTHQSSYQGRVGGRQHIQLVQRVEELPNQRGPRVTEIFDETDVRQAIQSLASQARVEVLMDDQVAGTCNAIIEEEPFESALEKLLLPLGLIYHFDGQRYLIGLPDPESALFPLMADQVDYHPLHLSPEELVELLPDRHRSFLHVVEKRNLIMIEAPRETAEWLVDRLARLDQPVPQVELEAIICVVSPESGFRFGLDWNHTLQVNGDQVLNVGMSGLGMSSAISPYGLNNALSDFAITSKFVRLLAQDGYLTIRAAPRVMAKDGEKATISIARETFFSIQPQSAEVLFRQDIEKVEAGISLDIIPVVRGDSITVTIERAEVSEDIRTSNSNPDISNNPFPLINRRTVTTTVDVKDGETIVIGGLVQRQMVDQLVQVPGLSHLPWVGKLFQTIEQREQDAEVAVFISPRIVTPDTSGPSMEVMERFDEIQ